MMEARHIATAQILAEAHTVGANALVNSAYRHTAMVERLLGGTTRHLLSAANLPYFSRVKPSRAAAVENASRIAAATAGLVQTLAGLG